VHEVLEYIAKNLVDDPDAVQIEVVKGSDSVTLRLTVAPDDMGKVIGRRGRTARAIRDVMRAAGTKAGVQAMVEIVG
jgi:predicted RNA-binding protein YlqC (UPF0109 family)